MANQWFRMYSEFATDPVVQSLAFEDQRHYVVLLCLKCQGVLDRNITTANRERIICRGLGLDPMAANEAKRRLMEVGLIEKSWQICGWDKRQFISDNSTERVRNYRKNKEQGNVSETEQKRSRNAPETDTETDKEKDVSNETSKKKVALRDLLSKYGIVDQLADDFAKFRNTNRWPITVTALEGFKREADKAGISTAEAVTIAIERSWRGFKAEWLKNNGRGNNENDPITIAKRRKAEQENWAYEWAWGESGGADAGADALPWLDSDIRQKVC